MPEPVQEIVTKKIYRSSAGSGKTFTLVLEWLKIVLPDPVSFKNVLALTFTNKAAAEMKSRVVKALRGLSAGTAPSILEKLAGHQGLSPVMVKLRAKETLSLILHDYSSFSVSTIDSFTHRIIRTFAREMGLPESFDVEMNTAVIKNEITDRLLDSVGKDPYVSRILLRFMEEKLDDEKSWAIAQDINKVADMLFSEGKAAGMETIRNIDPDDFDRLIQVLAQKRKEFQQTVQQLAETCITYFKQHSLTVDDFSQKGRGVGALYAKFQNNWGPAEIEGWFGNAYVQKALEEDNWVNEKQPQAGKVLAALAAGLRAATHALYDYYNEHFSHFKTLDVAYRNIHTLAVVGKLESLLEEWKTRENAIPISEFNKRLSGFIQEEDPSFVFWRLGERYHHFLLDEFQDTSGLQWNNLMPLFENLMAGSPDPGSLIIVGDSKQAVYRWRGGKVELLETEAPAFMQTEAEILDTNYRSGQYIIELNNALFEAMKLHFPDYPLLNRIYSDFAQAYPDTAKGKGYVSFQQLPVANFKEEAVTKTISQIRECLAKGFSKKDIAVLVRGNADGAMIARALFLENISVISPDSLVLSSAPEIAFLISAFRYLLHPNDNLRLAEVSFFYHHYLSADNAGSAERMRQDLVDGFKPFDGEYFHNAHLLNLPPYELAEELVRRFKLNENAGAFLPHFLDVVRDFSRNRQPDLAAFLEYWDDEGSAVSLSVPEAEDAVRVMTIHKAKGLQFPVVIVPLPTWSTEPGTKDYLWGTMQEPVDGITDTFLLGVSKQLQGTEFEDEYSREAQLSALDNLNMLYVALTRPETALFVFLPEAGVGKNNPISVLIYASLFTEPLASMLRTSADGLHSEAGIFDAPSAPDQQAKEMKKEILSYSWKERVSILNVSERNRPNAAIDSLDVALREVLIRMQNVDSAPVVVAQLLAEGWLNSESSERLRENLVTACQTPELIAAYSSGENTIRIRPEALQKGSFPVQVDRLFHGDDGLCIFQFVLDDSEIPQKKKNAESFGFRMGMGDSGKNQIHLIQIRNGKLLRLGN